MCTRWAAKSISGKLVFEVKRKKTNGGKLASEDEATDFGALVGDGVVEGVRANVVLQSKRKFGSSKERGRRNVPRSARSRP